MRLIFAGLTSIAGLLLPSCGAEHPPAGGRGLYKNEWIVTGKLTDQNYASGRVIAIGMDGTRFHSKIAKDNSFGIELPGNSTMALYFLSAADAQSQGIRQAAMLNFEESPDVGMTESLRLPDVMFNRKLSLGEVDIKADKAFCTVNPAQSLDFDMDGVVDAKDSDDQNDGLNDREQRKGLEHVNICHFTSESSGESKTIPISQMFSHIDHGDTVGPCRYLSPKPAEALATEKAPAAPKMPVAPMAPPSPMPAPAAGPVVTELTLEKVPAEGEKDEKDTKPKKDEKKLKDKKDEKGK